MFSYQKDKVIIQKLTKSSLFFILLGVGIFFNSLAIGTVGTALGMLVLVEKYIKFKIPTSFSIIFVIFITFSLILGSYFGFYEKYLWWDDMLHFSYGVGFAFIGYLIIYTFFIVNNFKKSIILIVTFSFCFSVTGGAIWEIFEYYMDKFLGLNMQRAIPDAGLETVSKSELIKKYGVNDTMNDIILESTAAFFTNIYIYTYMKSKENNWIGKLTKVFLKINENKFFNQ